MFFFLVAWFLNILLVLLSVAFFTLFERKVIGGIHIRLGPNKTLFLGVLQPLLDAFKLLSKQYLVSVRVNKIFFSLAPHLSLFFSLLLWHLVILPYYTVSSSFSIIVFLLIGSFIVFSNLIAGWSSNSKYTLIGSLRSIAQSVSYEAVITTLVIFLVVICSSYSLNSVSYSLNFFAFLIFPLWVVSVLAETHRAPFDFSERESELVSGYNTEYRGAYFAYVFLGEYSSLLFSCVLIYYLFFCITISPFVCILFSLFISFFFIVIRVSFCRFRYDYLIILAWKTMLPLSLVFLGFIYFFV